MSPDCELCGGPFHEEPETEGWQDIFCPGDNGTPQEQHDFLYALANAFAEYIGDWTHQLQILDQEIDRKKEADKLRKRSDVTIGELQDDCDVRTDTEVTRQKVAEVFQTPEFDVDIPHLTVPAETLLPRPVKIEHVLTEEEKKAKYDFSLFLDPDPDSLPPGLP